MKLQPTALLKTLSGKTVVALLVVMSGVGAAAAAGADVPLVTSLATSPTHSTNDEPAEEPAEEPADGDTSDEGVSGVVVDASALKLGSDDDDDDDENQSDDEDQSDGDDQGDDGAGVEQLDSEAGDVGDEIGEGDHPDNHGEVVSTFTRDNPLELEGCEKGQATAAVARGDVDPESDTIKDDLTPYLAKCGHGGDDESEESTADQGETPESTETEIEWKTLRDEGREAVHLANRRSWSPAATTATTAMAPRVPPKSRPAMRRRR